MRVVATGHRPHRITPGGFHDFSFHWSRLVEHARDSLSSLGRVDAVYTNLSQGWSQAVAQACIDLKIPYVACIPFVGFGNTWPKLAQRVYCYLLDNSKQLIMVSKAAYTPNKIQKCNEYMIDILDCDTRLEAHSILLLLWNGLEKGETYTCRQYAYPCMTIEIINTWDAWQKCLTGQTPDHVQATAKHIIKRRRNDQ